MKINSEMPDIVLLKTLGERLAALRLNRNLSQAQLAEQAGLGLRTVQRLELGESATQLSGFLRVCKVLGLIDALDALIPAPAPSPIALLKAQGRGRQRASGSRKVSTTDANAPDAVWTWGETE